MSNYARLKSNAEQLAKISLSIGAIKLNPSKPFTWASGYRMPIYNDNRMLLGNYEHRRFVAESFRDIIKYSNILVDIVAGTSTAGIPPATTLADMITRPLIYVRDKPKDHGMKNRIEGIDAEKGLDGKDIVLVEDLISMGGSSASAVDAIRKAGGNIDYCLSIFNYGLNVADRTFMAEEPFDKEGSKLDKICLVKSLLDFNTLIAVAKENSFINTNDLFLLAEWRKDPLLWGEKNGFPRIVKK